ncbi:MAG: AMP-binding protein, partial [Patescibacteria group bacterium]
MTTSIPKITVKDKNLKFKPNVVNYEVTYRDYNLSKLIKENIDLFPENKINAAYNAVDRQILGPRKNKIALYHLDQELKETKLTFFELYQLSNRFGNLLKSLGVGRGDRVFFFLPRIPELFYGFLGTLKVGAVAGTMFSAFGVQALIDRLADSAAKVVITNKELLPRITDAKKQLPDLEKVLVVEDF